MKRLVLPQTRSIGIFSGIPGHDGSAKSLILQQPVSALLPYNRVRTEFATCVDAPRDARRIFGSVQRVVGCGHVCGL